MNPLLSVIIPCYNTGKYIERCLKSVLTQNYKNIEVIVIDDGSTDNTGDIVKAISKQDNRVRYIYKENSGVSDTRNKGLKVAKGDYITFVDSDDTVLHEMYVELMNIAIAKDVDIAHCSYQRIENNMIRKVGNTGKMYSFEGEEVLSSLLRKDLFTAGVWNKIYTKSILNDIEFDVRFKINEDVLFNFYAFRNANSSIFYDKSLYEYHIEESSSCINTNRVKVSEDCYEISKIIYIESKDTAVEKIAYSNFASYRIGLYRVYKFYGNKNQIKLAKNLRGQIIEDYNNKCLCGTQKYNGFIIKYFNFLYKPFYLVYNKIRKPNWDV